MTTVEPLNDEPPRRTLNISIDGDLLIDFRNRDPDNPTQYLDYPADTVGVFTVYADLRNEEAERVSVTGVRDGYHMWVRLDASKLNTFETGILWGFRAVTPDAGFDDGTYDRPLIVGTIVRKDGELEQ